MINHQNARSGLLQSGYQTLHRAGEITASVETSSPGKGNPDSQDTYSLITLPYLCMCRKASKSTGSNVQPLDSQDQCTFVESRITVVDRSAQKSALYKVCIRGRTVGNLANNGICWELSLSLPIKVELNVSSNPVKVSY
jgi:hypothetical protein